MTFLLSAGSGVVSKFDEGSGIGTIAANDGRVVPFHCVVISDNSRTIEVGEAVYFSLFAATRGRIEASRVDKI